MLFKDRAEAGQKLAQLLAAATPSRHGRNKTVVVSLLRGGIIVGDVIAKKLSLVHLPLVVTKITAPYQEELAIGALCFDQTYWERSIVNSLSLSPQEKLGQRKRAENKFHEYCRRFGVREKHYAVIKDKNVILVDDGIATGATTRVANLFLKNKGVKKVIIASPVAPTDFDEHGFDEIFILHKDPYLSAISRFYESFPQVEDAEVNKILNPKP